MAQPLVMGDKIQGQCAIHQVPNPATGAPQPSPAPLPFSAPLLSGGAAGALTLGGGGLLWWRRRSTTRASAVATVRVMPLAGPDTARSSLTDNLQAALRRAASRK